MIERLYIHVPFCSAKCAYCSFYSIPSADVILQKKYLEKLGLGMRERTKLCGKLKSIYIGGGTPSFLPPEFLQKIFEFLKENFSFSKLSCEITVECNPETVDPEKADIIAKFANRISLGLQSFNQETRRILGRKSAEQDFFRAVELFRKNELQNLSCDLIHNVPGQTLSDYSKDLELFLALNFKHLSSYSLSLEEGTLLAQKKMTMNKPDVELKIWRMTDEILSASGIKRYEVSNFSLPGYECAHNLEIWFGDKYLGFGPSSASFDGVKRWKQKDNLADWLNGVSPELDLITPRKRAEEILIFGLRTLFPWTDEFFFKRTGLHLKNWERIFLQLAAKKLVKYNKNSVVSTTKGLLLWDSIAEELT
jgi:oxygen-independent coproporphyrinogen-3 oxidase